MPSFTVGTPQAISELPASSNRAARGQMEPVFEKLGELKRGQALPLTFKDQKAALAARAALRKIAKREGEFLSSTWGPDRKTMFFWIEPKEVAADAKTGKTR